MHMASDFKGGDVEVFGGEAKKCISTHCLNQCTTDWRED